jgi:hypothetical protein
LQQINGTRFESMALPIGYFQGQIGDAIGLGPRARQTQHGMG